MKPSSSAGQATAHSTLPPAVPLVSLGLAGEGLRRPPSAARRAPRSGSPRARPGNGTIPRLGDRAILRQQGLVASPADLDAAEQIGLGARHAIEPLGPEARLCRRSRDRDGSVTVVPRRLGARAGRASARAAACRARSVCVRAWRSRATSTTSSSDSALTTETPTPCRPPEVCVDLAAELAAGVQRGEDDLERRLVLGIWDAGRRDAAAIVAHQHAVAAQQLEMDRSSRRGRRPPRPWRCRAPRPRDGAAPARRCRRYTCRGACGRARAPPAPRCRGRCRNCPWSLRYACRPTDRTDRRFWPWLLLVFLRPREGIAGWPVRHGYGRKIA